MGILCGKMSNFVLIPFETENRNSRSCRRLVTSFRQSNFFAAIIHLRKLPGIKYSSRILVVLFDIVCFYGEIELGQLPRELWLF
jgi:hypothetical protein